MLNNPLGRAIRASSNDPVVGPSNIEDTTQGLQDVVHKKGKLSYDFNEIRVAENIERTM